MRAAPRPATARMPDCVADQVAAAAAAALLAELETWPKPGLVSHVDFGQPHRHGCMHFQNQRCGNHAGRQLFSPTSRRDQIVVAAGLEQG